MFPKPTGRVKTQELENRPTEAALRVAAKVALLDGQTEYEFIWNDEATSAKYMIKLRRSEKDSKLIDWGLYLDADPEALELWSHTGSDIADVHARVASSTDKTVNAENTANGNGSGQIAPETQLPEPQPELEAASPTAPEISEIVETPVAPGDTVEPIVISASTEGLAPETISVAETTPPTEEAPPTETEPVPEAAPTEAPTATEHTAEQLPETTPASTEPALSPESTPGPTEPAPSAEPFAGSPEPAPAPEQPSPDPEATLPPKPFPAPPSASPFGTLIKHAAKIIQSAEEPPKMPPPPPPRAKTPEPDYEAQEGNPLSWEEQCRTFDGVDSLPIVEIDRLSRVEEPGELSGDLTEKDIAEVLRAIASDVLSGRLSIDSKQKQADIFFFEGTPIHATGSMGEGMEGMLRVVGLEEGHYRFDARMSTDQRTVELPLETVIFQGAQLADDTRFLTELHLTSDSFLVRKNQYLSEKGFEALLTNGEPLDLNLQKSVYLAVDGQTSLKEIVRRLGLTRTAWVPVVANMIRCKVIAPMQVKARAKVNVKPKVVEPELLASVTSKLINDTSRMLTHPALIFMLEHEANRADIDHPLSLLLFEVGETQSLGGSAEAVPEWALNRIIFLMSGFKRRTDIFGHYEKSNEFALVMPDVKPGAVQTYAKDWVERVLNDSVIRDIANNLKFYFGIASIPDEAINVPLLLSAAELAKKHSVSSGLQVVLAKELEAVIASRNTPLAPR